VPLIAEHAEPDVLRMRLMYNLSIAETASVSSIAVQMDGQIVIYSIPQDAKHL